MPRRPKPSPPPAGERPTPAAKHPFVSLWSAPSKRHGWLWRLDYRVAGKKVRERLGPSQPLAEKRAAKVSEQLGRIKSGDATPTEALARISEQQTLKAAIDDYVRHLKTTASAEYVDTVGPRLRKLYEAGHARRIGDLKPAAVERLVAALRSAKPPVGETTIGYYRRQIHTFARWLKDHGRLGADPFDGYRPTRKAATVDARRAFTAEEVAALERACFAEPADNWHRPFKMTGPRRWLFYRFLAMTGLRVKEARRCEVSWLRRGDRPHLALPAAATKARRTARQPVPAGLLEELVAGADPSTGRLFADLPAKPIVAFEHDRKAAGIEKRTAEGKVDLHALRHTFVTNVLRGGANLKVAQMLARHASPQMTLGVYAHATDEEAWHAAQAAHGEPEKAQSKAQSRSHTVMNNDGHKGPPDAGCTSAGGAGIGPDGSQGPIGESGYRESNPDRRLGKPNTGVTDPVASQRDELDFQKGHSQRRSQNTPENDGSTRADDGGQARLAAGEVGEGGPRA